MILDAIKRLVGGIWGYLAAAGAIALAVLLALAKAKKAGRDEVIADSAVKEAEHAKKANEIGRDVATAKPDDVRDRLRKYQRD